MDHGLTIQQISTEWDIVRKFLESSTHDDNKEIYLSSKNI